MKSFYNEVFKPFTKQGSLISLIWGSIIFTSLFSSVFPQPYSTILWVTGLIVLATNEFWRPERILHNAAESGNVERVQEHLRKGGNVNIKSIMGDTALHHAAKKAHLEIVELLIAYNAKVNATSEDFGDSPLHEATIGGNEAIVKLLIENGAIVNVRDRDQLTPLHYPLHYTGAKNKTKIVSLLIKNRAEINAKDKDGATPLHKAALHGYQEISELLIENDAEINARMRNGKTPLNLALEGSYETLAELLKTHGAIE